MAMLGAAGSSSKCRQYKATCRSKTITSESGFTMREINEFADSRGVGDFVALDAESGRALNPDNFCPKYVGNIEIREVNNTK